MSSMIRAGLCGLAAVCALLAQGTGPAGHYEGTIQAPNREVNFSIDLEKNEKQVWTGYLSMNPGPKDLPLDKIEVKEDTISFSLAAPNAPAFTAKWDKEAAVFKGTASAPQGDVPFEMKRTGEARKIVVTPSSPLSPEFRGTWDGALEAGGRTLRLQVQLKQGADGKAAGTLVSLDQGGQEIPITTITQSANKLEFEIRMVGGTYKGTMNEAKTEIAGEWTQGGRPLPLAFKKAGGAPEKK